MLIFACTVAGFVLSVPARYATTGENCVKTKLGLWSKNTTGVGSNPKLIKILSHFLLLFLWVDDVGFGLTWHPAFNGMSVHGDTNKPE